jgi:acetylornithine deacetylase
VHYRRADRHAPVFGHKGKLAVRCRVEGHACHSAYAPEGVNAISYAARLISRLDALGESLAQQQDSRFSPPSGTLQVGTIQGGAALNIVPQSCWFDFEIRYLPGMRPQAVTDALAIMPASSCFRRCARWRSAAIFISRR